jgi:cytochrome P450
VAPIDLGPERAADALTRLVYTRATVQEALRLYPPAYGIFRVSLIDPAIGSKGWISNQASRSICLLSR